MGEFKNIQWGCLKCKNEDNCYNCDKLEGDGLYPSFSNIMRSTPIIKNIIDVFDGINYEIYLWKFNRNYISDEETTDMKHIFGIKSYTDLSPGNESTLFSMNDFDVTYLKDENKYVLGVETFLSFKNGRVGEENYVKEILRCFTEWMNDNGYDTNKELSLYDVFTNGVNVCSKFDSIEDAYAAFKMLVRGFCGND